MFRETFSKTFIFRATLRLPYVKILYLLGFLIRNQGYGSVYTFIIRMKLRKTLALKMLSAPTLLLKIIWKLSIN